MQLRGFTVNTLLYAETSSVTDIRKTNEGFLLKMCVKLESDTAGFQCSVIFMLFFFAVTQMEKRQWESLNMRRL